MKRFFLRCDATNRILCVYGNQSFFALTKDKFSIDVGLFNDSVYIDLPDTCIDFYTKEEIKIKKLSKVAI
jgi:hypothetical protein